MTSQISPALMDKFAGLKVLSLDVDGVLTDGGLYVSSAGEEFRRFNTKDGMGLKLAMRAGVAVAIISAGSPGSIEHRGKSLGVNYVLTKVPDKLEALRAICDELGVGLDQAAHMGDDINDLPLMRAVGLAIAPADAMAINIGAADFVTAKLAGHGAVRDVCDLIVAAKQADGEMADGTNM